MDLSSLFRRTEKANDGMHETIRMQVTYRCGFEAFNLRPYQCYETWCCGYEVQCLDNNGKKWYNRSRSLEEMETWMEAHCADIT